MTQPSAACVQHVRKRIHEIPSAAMQGLPRWPGSRSRHIEQNTEACSSSATQRLDKAHIPEVLNPNIMLTF
jgi:hypothetical protein